MSPRRKLDRKQIEFFWSKIKISDGCWEWQGYIQKSRRNYAVIKFWGRPQRASRVMWLIEHGRWPGRFFVCHRCDNPKCVRPSHLFLATQKGNMRDMLKKGRDNYARGEKSGASKLTTKQILEIRKSNLPQRILSKIYGVVQTQIGRIKRKERWAHVPEM